MPIAPWKRVGDIQAALSARDRARVECESSLLSRAECEKYIAEVTKLES